MASVIIRSNEWPQDETWTDFDGPSWIQYDLFRKNKLPGSKNVNLAKFMLRANECRTLINPSYCQLKGWVTYVITDHDML